MDPLSELVWSPQNGLSLRCADSSFTGKRELSSPAIGVGPNNNTVIPERSRSNHEAGFRVDFRLRTRDVLDRTEGEVNRDCWPSNESDRPSSGTGGCMEDVNTVAYTPAEKMAEEKDMLECKMENKDDVETGEGNCRTLLDTPEAIGGNTGTLLASDVLEVGNALNRDLGTMMNGAESCERRVIAAENEEGDITKRADRMNVSYPESVESMAENDLPILAGPASKTLGREERRRDKERCLPDEADTEKSSLPRRPLTESGSRKHRVKGKGKEKEKALSDGNIDGKTWKDIDDDESFVSVESCNSAGLFSKSKKRSNFEQQMTAGSKRIKTQIQECKGSTSKLRQDSSFANWISNMMKGFWKANEEDNSHTRALTIADSNDHVNRISDQHFALCFHKEDDKCRNTGFQSFFQSIYHPRKKIQDAEVHLLDEECDTNVAPLSLHGKLPCSQEQFLIANENHVSSSGNEIGLVAERNVSSGKVAFSQAIGAEDSCNCESFTDKEAKGSSSSSHSKSKPNEDKRIGHEADGKEIQTFTKWNDVLRSLWISRFSTRNSSLQSHEHRERVPSVHLKVEEANESASDMVKPHRSLKTAEENCVNSNLMHNLNPIVSSPRMESSEALASLFARRLDAIKHIVPLDFPETLTCFYCGKKGHHLRDCSEVTDTELNDLMRNINAQNGKEKASGLCGRCFQLNHWAATCPNAPQGDSRTGGNRSRHHESTMADAEFLHDEPIEKRATEVPRAIREAVQVLRLSRTDIVKWMNSKTYGSSLEGFFLRLRLGKWEEGLEGTGYYVACITGNMEEQSLKRGWESSISVKVGGTTCLVESQYISNHDFHEEELKAWWRVTAKSGGSVPSEGELSRKIRQRKMLRF